MTFPKSFNPVFRLQVSFKKLARSITAQEQLIFLTEKRLLFCFSFLFLSFISNAQSYLGTITKQVNFRAGPGTDYNVISSLKVGTNIFVVSLDTENDFYDIIDIRTNKEGFVNKSFVKIGKEIEKNEQGMFSPSGQTETYNPEVEIYNATRLTLTLKLNKDLFSFAPQEKRSITLEPGSCDYRASAAGVIPSIGTENLQSNNGYTWKFYIITTKR
jgi:hypothetical protein